MRRNSYWRTVIGMVMAVTSMTALAQTNDGAVQAAAPSAVASAPQRVLILGDSMMRLLSHSLERELAKHPGVTATTFTSLGSGLARLDAFDWLGKMRSAMEETKADTVIVALGTNDKQALQMNGGGVFQPGDPTWAAEYARRVGAAMDILVRGGARQVIWMELPDMRVAKNQADAMEINAILRREAGTRAIRIFETKSILSRKPGTFSPYLIGIDGMPLAVRDADGVHLSRAGADLMAAKLMAAMGFADAAVKR